MMPSEIDLTLKELPEWTFEDDRLNRELELETFPRAISLLVRIAFDAEALNHYPEIFCVQNHLAFALTSADAEMRVTQRDVVLAHKIETAIIEFMA